MSRLSPDHHLSPAPPDYEKKYAETFRTLREDEHFADVTLACEGRAVKAHRIILCACSGYFGHILRTINPAQVREIGFRRLMSLTSPISSDQHKETILKIKFTTYCT